MQKQILCIAWIGLTLGLQTAGSVAAAPLHFPHLILEGSSYVEYVTEAEFIDAGPQHWARVPKQWDRSVWEERRIVHRIGDTVHATGRWARLDKAGQTFQRADVMYGVTKKNDRWAIFARSGGPRQVLP